MLHATRDRAFSAGALAGASPFMAAAAQSSRPDVNRSGASRIASPELRSLFRRRMSELGGLALALAGVALLVALACYDPHDPSLNTATARHTANLVGPPGAMAADLLLQGFGLAGGLPALALLAWAWRMASHGGMRGLPLRIAALLAAMPVLGGVLAAIPTPRGVPIAWPAPAGLGGAGGRVVARHALDAAAAVLGPTGGIAAGALGAVLAVTLTLLALGLSWGEWRAAGRAARVSAYRGGRAVGFFGRLSRRVAGGAARLLDRINGTRGDEELPRETAPRAGRLRPRVGPSSAPDEPISTRRSRDETSRDDRRGPAARGTDERSFVMPEEPEAFVRPDPRAAVPVMRERKGSEPRLRAGPSREATRDIPSREPPAAPVAPPRAVAPTGPLTAPGRSTVPAPPALTYVPPPPVPAVRAAPPASAAPPLPKVQPPARPTPPAPRQEALPLEGSWRFPTLDLLSPAPSRAMLGAPSEAELQANARLLETVLGDYGVQGQIVEIRPGPVVTLYELEPAPGIRSARVIGLADDVARSLCVTAVRIATVSGRNVIGIEVPNAKRETVYLSELIASEEWARQQSKLALALGKDISGAPVVADLARMPHLLVAGTTGSGKSVGINAMILSLLFRMSPDQCRLILIDPKMLELSVYEGIPHLMAPVVTEPAKAVSALKWTVREMERRYRAMSQLSVRNIGGYNDRVTEARAKGEIVTRRVQVGFDSETGRPVFEDQALALEPLPFIVVVIDEMADLMMVAGKEIEAAVQRLAQMARAAGIHVVMATQRPSVDVITGTIKANFPTRISFQVISKFDSRTILGEQGSEQLLGQGDMLFMVGGGKITRVHGPYVSDGEVERIVAFLREQGEPAYLEEVTEAPEDGRESGMSGISGASDGEKGLFDQAVDIVAREGKASVSFIQRHLQIGYNKAARLMEQMEKEGIVGPANRVGKREILTRRHDEE
jgi:S-DNA-T family DNA segregation ATPase FtsK/SpoIIIE